MSHVSKAHPVLFLQPLLIQCILDALGVLSNCAGAQEAGPDEVAWLVIKQQQKKLKEYLKETEFYAHLQDMLHNQLAFMNQACMLE